MSFSRNDILEIINKSQRNVIRDLSSLCKELINKLKEYQDMYETEKILEQILDEEVKWHEC